MLQSLAEKKKAATSARRAFVHGTPQIFQKPGFRRTHRKLNRPITARDLPCDSLQPARSRLSWLDFFRGVAVLVMIETHVVNTFMASGLRESPWFPLLNFANGLVAPSFLFIAGFVQGMERRIAPGKPINYRRRASRLVGIAALGYALHFPVFELVQHRWADAFRVGTRFDVLQCLALSLGLLLGVTWLAEKMERAARSGGASREGPRLDFWDLRALRFRVSEVLAGAVWWIVVVALAITVLIVAPLVPDWVGGPIPLRAMVNQTTGSFFPLLPWTGFVLLGALAGAWPPRPMHERAAGMAGLAVLAWACRGETFSAVGPSFFLERAGWVLVLATVFEWSARHPLPAPILFAGKRSLTLYATHLALITALVGLGVPVAVLPLSWTLLVVVGVVAASFSVTRVCVWFSDRKVRDGLVSAPVAGPPDRRRGEECSQST